MLLGDIQAHNLAKTQVPDDRRQDAIHASEMSKGDWCPRHTYYRIAGTDPSNPQAKKFSFQLETVFEEGNEIHSKFQNWLREMGRLWGLWKCWQCHETWLGLAGEGPHFAEHPQVVEYKEVPLNAEETHRMIGHADGAVPDIRVLIEIKSIGLGTLRWEDPGLLAKYLVETVEGKKIYDLDALWKGLIRPLPSHIRQGQTYLWMCKQMGLPYDRVVFLYEYKPNQGVKEFSVKYSEHLVEPLLDLALDIKYALEKSKAPERPPHTGPETKTCKGCQFLDLCYGRNEGGKNRTSADEQLGSADGLGEGNEDAGAGGDLPPAEAGARRPRTAGRPHRTRRQRSDDPVSGTDGVDRLHGSETGGSRGRRKVRRRVTGQDEGVDSSR